MTGGYGFAAFKLPPPPAGYWDTDPVPGMGLRFPRSVRPTWLQRFTMRHLLGMAWTDA